MDLVLAVGRPSAVGFYDVSDGWFGWDGSKLGLFLQERFRPERVYVLAIEPGVGECYARILRVTATDTVISCGGEKSEVYPNRKFVYDVRAKRLVSRFAYEPFSMSRVKLKRDGTGAVFVGSDGTVQVQVDFQPDRVPEFKVIASVKEATVSELPRFRGAVAERAFVPPRFGFSGTFTLAQIQKGQTDEPELVVQEIVGRRRRSYRLPLSNHEAFGTSQARTDTTELHSW